MKVGTKSILFGSHQFVLHPLLIAIAWWKLYGAPCDPRLWVAFVVHDLGYWGKPNMDGPEGSTHVLLGGRIMKRFFGEYWEWFTVCHSRYWAYSKMRPFSRLAIADKHAIVITPAWLFMPLARASGELYEYMCLGQQGGKYDYLNVTTSTTRGEWNERVKTFLRKWIEKNKYEVGEYHFARPESETFLDKEPTGIGVDLP